jgi:small basic protein
MIEVKRKGGVLSEVQKEEIPKIQSRDIPVAVVYSLDEAIHAIRQWGIDGTGVAT